MRRRRADPEAARVLGAACGVGAAAAQILIDRDLGDPPEAIEFLEARLSGLTDPSSMLDRDAAAERIAAGIRREERIVVFGDYDVDGTTSAVILADGIEALGGRVEILCANRFEGGYGLSGPGLARCLELRPALLITCDCGSSDHERIAQANARGVDVVVVDHHLVPDEPLPALAFINPHRPECAFAYKGMSSAGLAFSLVAALRRRLGARLEMRRYLDLVALGTVADVAPLDGDNRRLVRAGLQRLSSGASRPGVQALLELARIGARAPIGGQDIAFRL
ncbi:MAG: DHH family phosphoesterase, partial [Myxococcales bacterium]|nr:DHH family phosphoesterase [Myxococcales bacterium]